MSAPGYSLRKDWLLWTLVGVLLVFTALQPAGVASYPRLVNWPTIETLAGLLLLTGGIEASGFLHRLAGRIVQGVHDGRHLALFLVAASAALAAVLTNDIALFIVVPLTLTLANYAHLPVTRLIAFEALAVNTGSMLTPIGNPQNIFLWQASGVHFFDFMGAMTAPTLIAAICLLGFTLLAFKPRPLTLVAGSADMDVDWHMFIVSTLLFVPFIVAADLRYAGYALAAVAVLFLALFRSVLRRFDWALLLVFVLMFVDLRLVAGLPAVQHVLGGVDLKQPPNVYLAGALVSQFISNVPATILLANYSSDWQSLAWGVDMGGFGLVVGSLANIIALRLAGPRASLPAFHAWAAPFLLLAGGLTYIWMRVHGGG
ncbi:MAG TPA: SLC13 family permease [Gammaproteobacteria bacterium]|jgi:Na+/H+ antiporter NhaD/arsenite permease-like protein